MINFEKLIQLSGHTSPVYALEAGDENPTFYSGGGDQLIVQWDLQKLDAGIVVAKTSATIYSLKLIANKQFLLAGTATGFIHVIALQARQELRLLHYHQQGIFDIQVSEKNNLLILVGGDGLLSFCNLDNYSLIKQMQLSTHKLRSAAFNSDETLLAIGCGDGTIAFVEIPSMQLVNRIAAHKPDWSCNIVAFVDDTTLLSGGRDAILNVINVADFEIKQTLPAHNYSIYDIQFSADRNYFATASRDKSMKIWSSKTFDFIQKLDANSNGHLNSVNKILWSAHQNYIISASDDRSLIIWQPVVQTKK